MDKNTNSIILIKPTESYYPPLLKEISDPPELLYCRGGLSRIAGKTCVAVVGTRKPTAYGIAATEKIVAELVAAGIVIVSGLAFGIDIAAHRAALKNNGITVAVVPGGVDELSIYPQSHAGVAAKIAQTGCIISERISASPALPYTFLARNRIIAGMCPGTLVIECAEKSGALITARFARDENRTVYAVPGSIFSPQSAGPHALLAEGAIPVGSADDILKDLGLTGASFGQKRESLSENEKLMLQYINSAPVPADTIIKIACRETKLSQAEIIAALSALEIKGFIAASGPGQYCLIK